LVNTKDYVFLQQWRKTNRKILHQLYPEISKQEINNFLDEIINENLKNHKVILDNNYINKQINTNLLDTINWINNTDPICAGHGVLYKNQHQVVNPLALMIQKFLTSRKKFKNQLKFIEDKTSYEYQTFDRKQLSEKISANSIYGTFGNVISFLFNTYTAPSVTGSGQSLISTTEQAFESFLANNSLFNNVNECFTFLNNVLDEEYSIDSTFLRNVTVDDVFNRLVDTFYNYQESYTNLLYPFLLSLTQDQLNRIYYKNNIYEFSMHNKIISLLVLIVRNTKEFKDPNKVPETSKEYLEELWAYYKQFVLYNYSPIHRIQRLKNDKRKVVLTIDTDSNFLNLNPWVQFMFTNIINNDYTCEHRDSEELRFIAVNTMAFIITNMMQCVLQRYTKDANIPKDYRHFINIKNEFLMSRVVLASKKKRYFSSIRLREGDEIYPEKIDLKGHDFIKSTASEETKNKFVNIIKERILYTKDIDVVEVLGDVEQFESEIINSLKTGEKKYLIPLSVKELEAYADPLRMQGVRAVITWNYIYPEMEIELPTKVDIVKVTLTEEKNLHKLKRDFPDIYKKVEDNILNNPDTRISSKGLAVIAIPRNVNQVPEWILPFIDYDTISYNVLSKFYPVLESLGLHTIKTSKKEYFSNILNI